ncbi:MAG: alpha/beta hydrolase-fold protein [Candidatus Sulfotelmatobacter sp.]
MTKQFPDAQLSPPLPRNENLRFLNFRGEALGCRGDVLLFAPPGFETLGRVPLLLLLHGVYGCQWNWWLNGDVDSVATEMLRDGKMLPMMIAMPSDGLWGDGSGYVPHAHADYEKWIVDDIPRCLRELFPQLHPGKFFIAGLSMGGYGALRLGMKYASRVEGISAHSSITQVAQLSQFIPFPAEAFQHAGKLDTDLLHWAKMNLERLPPIRFDCGTDDPLIEANRELHRALLDMDVRHEYQEFPGGHDWLYWTEHVRQTLAFCKAVLRE